MREWRRRRGELVLESEPSSRSAANRLRSKRSRQAGLRDGRGPVSSINEEGIEEERRGKVYEYNSDDDIKSRNKQNRQGAAMLRPWVGKAEEARRWWRELGRGILYNTGVYHDLSPPGGTRPQLAPNNF